MWERGGGRNTRGGRGGRGRGRGRGRGGNAQSRYDSNTQNGYRPTAPSRVEETSEQQQARASYNAWRRRLGEAETNPATMRRLWEGAFGILEAGDRDWRQRLPQDLDSDKDNESGRRHILAILKSKVVGSDYDTFLENARHFLLTLTHSSLLRCLAVDTHVGSIYNLFGGVGGGRAVEYLQRVCKALSSALAASSSSTKDHGTTLLAMTMALFELLRRERRMRINDAIIPLVDSIQVVSDIYKDLASPDISTRTTNRLNDIRALVARVQGLLAAPTGEDESGDDDDIGGNVSFYPRDLIVPSGRFDNDKKDIGDLIIFPTRDEIMSDAKEFLPYTDPDQPHFLEDPVERHIDTYFRLLRHDIFGELKGSLAGIMHTVSQDTNAMFHPNLNLGDTRANQYANARIGYVTFDKRKGLQASIGFLQPTAVRRKLPAQKEKWWEESRRFDEGSLLSFIWTQNSTVQHVFLTVSDKTTDSNREFGLTHDNQMAYVMASLVTQDKATVTMLMQANIGAVHGVLLEFPKVMPATFLPTLESLQAMHRLSRLPFRQWIVPEKHKGPLATRRMQEIPPPLYARTLGFKFPVDTLLKNKSEEPFSIEPTSSCDDTDILNKLEQRTQLDRGQCRALIAALTREFAFIQGPPGTGKSYLGLQIMRILLDIKEKADLGPILIVCYTNHALDQFLEHLLDIGVQKLIRVGGMSKSKKLLNHNLRTVGDSETKTKSENHMAAKCYQAQEDNAKEAGPIFAGLQGLRKNAHWHNLKGHILEEYPMIYSQFSRFDGEGYEVVGRHPFDMWIAGCNTQHPALTPDMSRQLIEKATASVFSLSFDERSALIAYWIAEAQGNKVGELFQVVDSAAKTQHQLKNVHEECNRRVLEGADVIGVTTSGLAKRISVLQQVKCKVIICEEAGEVMESHMISALLPDVEHLIQIGDHEQLRPSVTNFRDLSLESERGKLHALDRSQFERLSIGEPGRSLMPVAQLNVQRRMRPQISSLIRETIYDKLKDHSSTIDLPDVVGMRRNVFWLDHTNLENEKDTDMHNTKSKSNLWEVEMVRALVRHIVRQGVYKSDDIAVLTPYTGQLQKLRAAMSSEYEICLSDRDREALERDGFVVDGEIIPEAAVPAHESYQGKPLRKKQLSELLRVATVDNFQGEEAKIVIVSLVRSNEKRNVGFLKTTNRINVLLSRAQHGMYLIGNAETYSSVEMWQKVIGMLRAADSMGMSLALRCPRHPGTDAEVQQPDDFLQLSPEGGCREACADRLDCGHQCVSRCHSEAMHAVFLCEQPCQRRHQPCDHACQKDTCGESCGKCMILKDDVQLPCGHVKHSVACHRTQNLGSISCDVKVSKRVPNCGHDVLVKCSVDVSRKGFICPTPCTTSLSCGHPCPGICGQCKTKDRYGGSITKHAACSKTCGRKHGTCNHNCSRRCHSGTDCGLCQEACEVRCKHTRCPQRCHEPCAPCVETCAWSCEHQGDCKMPCSAPCNRLPCDERCTKLLPCRHQCPSICGEVCPVDYCQECGMKPEEEPDLIMGSRYAEIDLDQSPIVVLGCGHFFTTETLDGLVGLKDVYSVDAKTDAFTGLIENGELSASIPQCPHCREPIRQYVTQRYNRLINRAVIDEMSKRFIVNGQQDLRELEGQVDKLAKELEDSRYSIIPTAPMQARGEMPVDMIMQFINHGIEERSKENNKLLNEVKAFRRRVDIRHQPTYKLHQATLHNVAKDESLDVDFAKLAMDSSMESAKRDRDQRITLGGSLLEIKVRCLLLEDSFEIMRAVGQKHLMSTLPLTFPSGLPIARTEPFLLDTRKLIDDCTQESLPKLAVEATLYFARIAQSFGSAQSGQSNDRAKAMSYRNIAKGLLAKADELCENSFRDRDTLRQAIIATLTMLNKEFYETISKEELESIKKAMVSGRGGIATHSGHWYKCVNGHPFAIGECGMPMQQARCPECGQPVGGQNHTAVAGVSRAREMED